VFVTTDGLELASSRRRDNADSDEWRQSTAGTADHIAAVIMSFDGGPVRSVLRFIARCCGCDLGYRLLGQSAARRFGVEASMYRKSFDEGV
jgi:hypothetical protein